MRSLCAAAFVCVSMLLIPAAAEASPEHSGCSVELNAPEASVLAGESVTLSGRIICPQPGESGEQPVTIRQHTAGTHGAASVATVTSDPSGAFQFTSESLSSNSAFVARFARARSRRVAVKVAPAITLNGPANPLIRAAGRHADGTRGADVIVFSGTVTPVEPGARVVLQRERSTVPGSWRRIGVTLLGADGSWSIAHRFAMPGQATIRAVVRRRGQRAAASESLTYTIAQRQNPRLTIEATPNPLLYGQSVTIDGTIPGGASAPVALMARTHGGTFAPVEQATADAGGYYEFAPPAPLVGTTYEVTSGRLRSARVPVAVEPLLTSGLAGPTVESGHAITISGTLTPARAGQAVVLERLGPGLGYHPVATLAMGEGSQYSFEQVVSGTGKQIYRVRVPRDGGLQSTAGEPLEVQVEPAAPTVEAEASPPAPDPSKEETSGQP